VKIPWYFHSPSSI